HLHGNRREQQSHQTLEGEQAAQAEEPRQAGSQVEHDRRREPCQSDRQEPFETASRLASSEQDDRRDRGRAGQRRNGERYDERFAFDEVGGPVLTGREHHPQGDEKEDHAARDAQRRLRHMERAQDILTAQERDDQDDERDEELANEYSAAPLRIHSAERDEQ